MFAPAAGLRADAGRTDTAACGVARAASRSRDAVTGRTTARSASSVRTAL